MIDPIDRLEQYFPNYLDPVDLSSQGPMMNRSKERAMRQLYRDLWVTEPEHPLPHELPDLTMHAYLLLREAGNVLFCRSEHGADHLRIRELGGTTRHYLTHWHEAAPGLARVKEMFGSELICHRLAEEIVVKSCPVDATFDRRETHLGDIEVIPTPGHTARSSCFLYRSPHGPTYLFAGDTVFPSRGTWESLVFEDGDEASLRASLATLRTLEPDVVLCGAAVGDAPFRSVSRAEWHAIVDQATRSLSHWPSDGRAKADMAGAAG
jgi:glyoxylase-like metal-dependent hydrolase (beta-lactamase superfamily II)